MAESITIARPYARAVFEAAQATDTLAPWSTLLQTAAQVTAAETLRDWLTNPKLSAQEKADLVLDVCRELYEKSGAGELPEAGRNFIYLLAENQRLDVLPDIAAIYEMLRAEAEKTVHAQLITAFAVNDKQRDKIAKKLKARLKRTVVLECTVDPALMGGAIIRAGDLVIDGSVRGQLNRLAAALQH